MTFVFNRSCGQNVDRKAACHMDGKLDSKLRIGGAPKLDGTISKADPGAKVEPSIVRAAECPPGLIKIADIVSDEDKARYQCNKLILPIMKRRLLENDDFQRIIGEIEPAIDCTKRSIDYSKDDVSVSKILVDAYCPIESYMDDNEKLCWNYKLASLMHVNMQDQDEGQKNDILQLVYAQVDDLYLKTGQRVSDYLRTKKDTGVLRDKELQDLGLVDCDFDEPNDVTFSMAVALKNRDMIWQMIMSFAKSRDDWSILCGEEMKAHLKQLNCYKLLH